MYISKIIQRSFVCESLILVKAILVFEVTLESFPVTNKYRAKTISFLAYGNKGALTGV